jgi:competence protein ComEC
MRWSSFPFLRIVFALIVGILLSINFELYSEGWFIVTFFLLATYVILHFVFKPAQKRKYNFVFGLLGLLGMVSFGISATFQKTEILQANHFANLSDSITYYEAIIDEEVQEKTKSYKAEVVVKRIFFNGKWTTATGRILLYIKKLPDSSSLQKYEYGDKIIVQGAPQRTLPPANPKTFDFEKYLAYQQIYHQQFVEPSSLRIIGNEPSNPILDVAIRVRRRADSALRKYIDGKDEYAIVTALVIGIKDNLDNAIRNTYSNTGAMHVLAVSGLHVGILLKILEWLFAWIKRKGKYGNWIFLSVVVIGLWFYAFVTGLSPSVLRAVLMFSLVAVAKTIQRNSNIYNTIAFSAFLILCYDPYLLLSVSFQLSYLAVIGIVYFYNKVYDLLHLENILPKLHPWVHKILDFVWSITCVSVAAQIGTFPIGMYYFHQFPVYFMLSNLVVIPLATWIFGGGLAIILVDFVPIGILAYPNLLLGFLTKWAVWAQNWLLFAIEDLPYSVINGLHISLAEVLLIYSAIVYFSLLFVLRKFRYLIYTFILVLALSVAQFMEYFEQKTQSSFYIFNANKNLNLSILEGNQNMLIADSSLLYNDVQIRNQFYNYWASKGIAPAAVNYFNVSHKVADNEKFKHKLNLAFQKSSNYNLLIYKGKTILWVVNKTNEYLPKADYLLISNNAIRNLETLNYSKFGAIILDASNSRFNSAKLEKQAKSFGINLYAIHTKGGYVKKF